MSLFRVGDVAGCLKCPLNSKIWDLMSPGDGFAGLPALLPPSTPRNFYEMVDFGQFAPRVASKLSVTEKGIVASIILLPR
jgi:hypothetical protein